MAWLRSTNHLNPASNINVNNQICQIEEMSAIGHRDMCMMGGPFFVCRRSTVVPIKGKVTDMWRIMISSRRMDRTSNTNSATTHKDDNQSACTTLDFRVWYVDQQWVFIIVRLQSLTTSHTHTHTHTLHPQQTHIS
jgi:hypothetical protein